jgi:hypothetical protein
MENVIHLAAYTDNDISNCKLIGILMMVYVLREQIQAEKNLDEQEAAEKLAQSVEDLIVQCRDLFPTNKLLYAGIKSMAWQLGMDMKMEEVNGDHDQGINRVC